MKSKKNMLAHFLIWAFNENKFYVHFDIKEYLSLPNKSRLFFGLFNENLKVGCQKFDWLPMRNKFE